MLQQNHMDKQPKEPPAAVSCLDGKTLEIGCVMAWFRGKNTEGFSEEIGNTSLGEETYGQRLVNNGDSLIFADVQYDEDTVHLKIDKQMFMISDLKFHVDFSHVSCL